MRLVFIAFSLFVSLALFVIWYLQEEFIFPASTLPPAHRFEKGQVPFEERSVTVDGIKVHSLFFRPETARNLILFFHGNAGHLGSWSSVAEAIAERTSSAVWMMDYPGYGLSGGRIRSEAQLHLIAGEFYRLAREEATELRLKLFLYGRSIGSGIAAQLAGANPGAAGLILETPYYGLERVVKETAWWAPLWLLKYRLRTYEVLPKLSMPILILHGDADQVIDVQHSRDLAPLNPAHAELVLFPGGHHSDLASYPKYWEVIEHFLR